MAPMNYRNSAEANQGHDWKSCGLLLVLLLLILYLTGVAGALMALFVVLSGAVLERFRNEFAGPIQWLFGIVASVLYLSFFLAWNDDVSQWFGSSSAQMGVNSLPYYSIPYTTGLIDPLTRNPALTGVLIPVSILVLLLLFKKRNPRVGPVARQNQLLLATAIVPALLASLVKLQSPNSLVAAAMSGDGRNHFILTETIRLNGELVVGKGQWGVPKLANGIAAWISAGNGASGALDKQDIYGMLSVYLLSFIGLSVVFCAGILLAGNYTYASRDSQTGIGGLAVITSFVVLSTFVIGNVLFDGFLSLSLGVLLLAISLVIGIMALEKSSFLLFFILGAIAFLMLNAYTFLGLPSFALFVAVAVRGVNTKNILGRWWLAIVLLGGVTGIYFLISVIGDYWGTFIDGVALAGSVAQVGPEIGWALFMIGLGGITGLFIGVKKSATYPTLISIVAAYVTIRLIEGVPGNEMAGMSYYSQKAFLGIMMANMWVLFVPLIPLVILRAEKWRGFSFIRKTSQGTLEILSVAALPLLVVSLLSPLPNTMGEIWKGWVNPDALTVGVILDEWESDDSYIFWRLTESPGRFLYPAPFADRVANLWSPATWDHSSVRGMGVIWNWIYFEVNSDSPLQLCMPLTTYRLRVITRDPLLESQVLDACGPNQTVFDVRPRLEKSEN